MKILKNKFLWTISLAIVLVAIFLTLMPKPIDMDLGKIGNGRASIVFIYDTNLASSNLQSIEINKARDVIKDKATFLVAKVGDPNSANFRDRYDAKPAELLFFNRNGELITKKRAVISAEEFIETMSGK